jgi:hypothetical protein
MKFIQTIILLMKLSTQKLISLKSPSNSYINSKVVKSTSRITLLILFIHSLFLWYDTNISSLLTLTYPTIITVSIIHIYTLKIYTEVKTRMPKFPRINLISLSQDIIYVITYNILNLSIIHIITLLWSWIDISNIHILSSPEITLPLELDLTIIEATISFWLKSKTRNKPSFVDHLLKTKNSKHTNEGIVLELLDELKIKGKEKKKAIITNTNLILNQIVVHYHIFPQREDAEFELILSNLPQDQIDELLTDFLNDVGSYRIRNLAKNVENQKLRKHLIKAIFTKYENLIKSKSERYEIMWTIKKELMLNNRNHQNAINKNITPHKRQYHTTTATNMTNGTKIGLWIILIIRLIARIIFYIAILNTSSLMGYTPNRTLQDEILDALDAAADQEVIEDAADEAQEAIHEAAELAAQTINNPEGVYNLSFFNVEEESNETSTPNTPTTPNNTPNEIDSEYETDSGSPMSTSKSEASTDSEDDSIFDSFIPIFFLTNKIAWRNVLITISLIILRIVLSVWDVSILDLLIAWDSWDINSDSFKSITPFMFNNIFKKIIKDILKIILQHLVNIITSIITSRVKGLLILGVTSISITNKGKEKRQSEESIGWDSDTSKYEESIGWDGDTSKSDGEFVYISAEQRKRLAQMLIQRDAHKKMGLTKTASETEPVFKDPWLFEPSRYTDNSKLKMDWDREITPSKQSIQNIKNTQSVQSDGFTDYELATLAQHLINRHKAKLEQPQDPQIVTKSLDLQSDPNTESFVVIAPTPTSTNLQSILSDSTERDYGTEMRRDDGLNRNKPLPSIPGGDINKRSWQSSWNNRESHNPSVDAELTTHSPSNTKSTTLSELGLGGKQKSSKSKPIITYYKLSDSTASKEFTLTQTTTRLKGNKNKNKK